MASEDWTLTIHKNKSASLSLIRDAVRQLYKVHITESNASTLINNKINTVINDTSRNKSNNVCPSPSKQQQVSVSSAVNIPFTQQEMLLVTLHFDGDISVEEIEKAKNFVRAHLLPGPDYTTDTHQLENQQEFNMVLKSSQDIQMATTALLTFDPECLEVTLHGSSSTVASARSKVVMLLDKLRDQMRTENSIDFKEGYTFYENLLLDNFVEKHDNTGSSKLSHVFVNGTGLTENINCKQSRQRVNDISHNVNKSQDCMVYHNTTQPNWHLIEPDIDSFDAIESDSAQIHTAPVISSIPHGNNTCKTEWRKPSSSSEDEGPCEENILTDPRYSKKIEQAMKLGYSERHVVKALVKHGPDCVLNDLLSELIKLGASDAEPTVSQILSPESDALFSNHSIDFGVNGSQRLNVVKLESGDSSSFSSSSDSHGSSIADISDSSNLRDVIIDGSNVAMSHGKKVFSCKGIQIAVNWFKERGHKNITAFIPQWRKETSRPDAPITDQEILSDLEKEGIVVFTPARRVKGRRVVCYDDRYILKLAVETDGIVVSNDVYRDLVNEREDFRKVVDQKLLMYSFVNDRFMPPEDPLGRTGPTLDNFLRKVVAEPIPKPQDCPYGKKCTYGNKCRFYHRERGFAPQKLITETLKEQADLKLQERATRLSEIAEKGKRSKQKLSRTKSLIPWDPLPSSVSVQVSGGEKSKQEKPKLSHSKSLVLPTKSCDYLNEPRKKLEEAELITAMMSAQDTSFFQQFPALVSSPDDSENRSKTKSPSQRSSPDSLKDVTKQTITPGDTVSQNSFPCKFVSTNSPRASPSHLTVPKSEPPERYLSGHLYLAKKLSDESVESNFFSEHTSSPSSTRTSSPVVALNKIPEQTQFPVTDTHSKNRQPNIPGSFTSPPPFHPSLLHQQQMQYTPQTAHDMDIIPNLSIFDQGISHFSNKLDSIDTSPAYKQDNVDNTFFHDYRHQKINSHLPDGKHYNSTESILSTYQDTHQLKKSYPSFQQEESLQSSDRLNLRRAFSTTGNFKTAEDLHQKLGRRASGFSSSHFGEDHFRMKPQNESLIESSNAYQFGHSYGLNRQNSSSDPQMHVADAGELQDVLSPIFSPGDSARNFRDMQSTNNQHFQTLQHQQKHFENQQQLERQKNLQQQQQQDVSSSSSHLSKPRMSVWGESANQSNLGHRSSVSGAIQSQYNQLQSHPLSQTAGYMSHFPPTTVAPNMVMASSYSPTSPYLPQHHYQPPMMYTTQHDPTSTNMFSAPRRQSFPHSNYPHTPVVQSNPFFGSITDHQNITPKVHPVSIPFILPEDTPILPEDPRYTIYYHLSNVFGERVVRIVMNRYPNEHNPNNVCKLILQYKEETGL